MLIYKKIISVIIFALFLISLYPACAASITSVEVANQDNHSITEPVSLNVSVSDLTADADNTLLTLGGQKLTGQTVTKTGADTYTIQAPLPQNALPGKNKLTVKIADITESTYIVLSEAEKIADGVRRNTDFTGLYGKSDEYISSAILLRGNMQGSLIQKDTDGNEYCYLSGSDLEASEISLWADELDKNLSFPREAQLLNPVVCDIEFDLRLSDIDASCNLVVYRDKSDLRGEFFSSKGISLGAKLPIGGNGFSHQLKLNSWHRVRVSINRLKNAYELFFNDESIESGELKLSGGNQISAFSIETLSSVDLDNIKFIIKNSTNAEELKNEQDLVFKGELSYDCNIDSAGNAFNASYELVNDSENTVSGSIILAGYTKGELSVLICEPYNLRPRGVYIGGKGISGVDYAKAFLWDSSMTPLAIAESE